MAKTITDPVVKIHQGTEIRLSLMTMRFYVKLEDGSQMEAESADKLIERIDLRKKVEDRAERRKLDLRLVDRETGTLRVATGINANSRYLNISPKLEERNNALYAELDWVVVLIARYVALDEHMQAIKEALKPARVDGAARGYGRIQDPELMEQLMSEVQEAYDKAKKAKPPANLDRLLA